VPFAVNFHLPAHYHLEFGRGVEVTYGLDAVVFAYGPVFLSVAVEAAQILKNERGITVSVINLPWLNTIDPDWLVPVVRRHRTTLSIDNHFLKGGQGDRIAAILAESGIAPGVFHRVGLTGIPKSGTNEEILQVCGITPRAIASSLEQYLKQ
jgi:transketolase